MLQHLGRLSAIWATAGGVVLLAVVAVTVVNAGAFGLDKLARFVGGTVPGLPGYEDFVSLAIGAAAPMFLPFCQLRRGHLSVDMLATRFTGWLNAALERSALMGLVGLGAFLAYWMTLGMLETRSDGALSRVLGWPVWPFYLPGIASLLLWAGVAAAQLWDPQAAAHLAVTDEDHRDG